MQYLSLRSSERLRMSRVAGLVVVTLLALGCGTETVEAPPGPVDRIRVVARPAATDTVIASPVQALVVEVRTEAGEPSAGVVVRFTGLPQDSGAQPSMWVRALTEATFGGFVAVTTDSRGQ